MTWTTLIGPKTQAGSIAQWANYSLLDSETILDESQALLYSEARLRTREMMADAVFTLPQFGSYVPLSSFTPNTFLEPIGEIFVSSFNTRIEHKDSGFIQSARTFTENTGTLSTNPFTTTNGSTSVSVYLPSHNLTQDSIFYTTGATAFNGVTLAGTFPVSSVTDTNDFIIDITALGTLPNAGGSGGGSAVAYTADSLNYGSPLYFGIYNERINFEQSFCQTSLCRMQFYQTLPLLSASNPTNFLTNRYPKLMRTACMAAAAEFMKDDTEYQKWLTRLQSAVQAISVENDMQYRGMSVSADTP